MLINRSIPQVIAALTVTLLAPCLSGCTSTPAAPVLKQAAPPAAPPLFVDVAAQAGLNYTWTPPGKHPVNILQSIGCGCAFVDYDNDGNLDILLVGPHPALFRGDGTGHFTDVTQAMGLAALNGHLLGCEVGDYDDDGKIDALVTDNEGKPLLLHNVTPGAGNWLLLALRGRNCNRDGYGALVTVTAGGHTVTRHCHAGGSYLSSSDKRLHFGLGAATTITRIVVQWPDGHKDVCAACAVNRLVTLTEGASQVQAGMKMAAK